MLASTAAIPLGNFPELRSSHRPLASEKTIDWGYSEGAVRLNANENPFGPSPLALKAMEKAITQGHRYATITQLRKDLASFLDVSTDMVILGCGSTEFLRIVPWAFLRTGGEVISAVNTYQTTLRECRKLDIPVKTVPLKKDFTFDLAAMKKEVNEKTKMVYLVNPNNPTGTFLDFEDVEKFCAAMPKHVIVFIDEAYFHFLPDSKGRDGITLIKQGHNVITTRTFSKVYGLAGIRLGYAIANPSLIKELRVFGFGDMGVNQAAYAAGVASLEDEKHIQKYENLVSEGKEFYYKQFDSMGLNYIRSITPFLMVKLNTSSKMVQKKLADKRVYVRKGEDWYMPGYLRITIGFPEENEACAAELKRVLKM